MATLRSILSSLCGAATLIAALSLSRARAVDFTFDYSTEEPNEGFNDPVLGPQRKQALEFAANIWGRLIRPAYPGENGTGEEITIRATFDSYDPGSSTLASAKPHYYYSDFASSSPAYVPNVNFPKALANHLHLGDLAPSRPDIEISVNEVQPFYYGLDGNPGATQFDFVSVALHEIGHGLGFSKSIREDGDYGIHGDGGYDPVCLECLAVPYDRFLTLGPNGTPLLALGDSGREFAVTSNNVFWNGAGGAQANSGASPQINAPNPWVDGSSISHVDGTAHSTALMRPSLGPGQVIQTPTAIDRGILRDLGWNISVAPQQVLWTAPGPDNKASTNGNWTAPPMPGDSLSFGAIASVTDVNMDVVLYSVGGISFSSAAPAYTLRFKPWTETDLVGASIVNDSPNAQTIILEHGEKGAEMLFKNSATTSSSAANATYEIQGGTTGIAGGPFPTPYYFVRTNAGRLTFDDVTPADGTTTTAATGTFNVEGGLGNGGDYGLVVFIGNATAGDAEFWSKAGRRGPSLPLGAELAGFGGRVRFEDSATANTAHFRNDGVSEYQGGSGGATEFFDSASAQNAEFDNYGTTYNAGSGGRTEFNDTSTAGMAHFTNHPGTHPANGGSGLTIFYGNSTAASGTFTNKGAASPLLFGGGTWFYGDSTADEGTFINEGAGPGFFHGAPYAGSTRFYENSNAGTATFHNRIAGGTTEFFDNASADDGTFIIETGTANGGFVVFNGSSKGGTADLTIQPFSANAAIAFGNRNTSGTPDAPNAEQAEITLQDASSGRLEFVENASAGQADIDIGWNGILTFGGYALGNSIATADRATIRLRPGAVGTFGFASSVGDATITVEGAHTAGGGQSGPWGALSVASATTGNAVITTEGGTFPGARGGNTAFDFSANAGGATLIAGSPTVAGAFGGVIQFARGGTAPNARVTINAGAFLDLTGNSSYGGTDIGSLEGAGTFILNVTELRTGSLNTSTTILGPLVNQLGYTDGKLTKVGTGTLTLAGNNTYTGLTKVNAGTLVNNGTIPGNVEVNSGGRFEGTGTVGGTVTFNAESVFAPGSSPGTFTLRNLTMMPGSTLDFELGDPASDHIIVTNNGNISLAGSLNVSLLDGFTPALGHSFALFEGAIGSITGAFSSYVAPVFNDLMIDLRQNAGSLLLQVVDATLPGDFNDDGTVDAADYVAWRNGLGAPYTQTHYNTWRAHFGQTAGSGAAASADANPAVPEPVSLSLMLLAAGSMLLGGFEGFRPLFVARSPTRELY